MRKFNIFHIFMGFACALPFLSGVAVAETILYQQPNYMDLDAATYFKPAMLDAQGKLVSTVPAGISALSQWNSSVSFKQSRICDWQMGHWTGLYVSSSCLMQRGVNNFNYGSTGVQAENGVVGINIETGSVEPGKVGPLSSIVYSYAWDKAAKPRPFVSNTRLVYALDLQVPYSEWNGNAVTYVVAYFVFRDTTTDRQFFYGASLYDSRGVPNPTSSILLDKGSSGEGTGLAIVSSAVQQGGPYAGLSENSVGFATSAWYDFRHFEFVVDPSKLANAAAALNSTYSPTPRYSTNPGDYELTEFNLNPEVYQPTGSYGHLGLSFKNLTIRTNPIEQGFFINGNGQRVQWLCGKLPEDAGWVAQPYNCYHRIVPNAISLKKK